MAEKTIKISNLNETKIILPENITDVTVNFAGPKSSSKIIYIGDEIDKVNLKTNGNYKEQTIKLEGDMNGKIALYINPIEHKDLRITAPNSKVTIEKQIFLNNLYIEAKNYCIQGSILPKALIRCEENSQEDTIYINSSRLEHFVSRNNELIVANSNISFLDQHIIPNKKSNIFVTDSVFDKIELFVAENVVIDNCSIESLYLATSGSINSVKLSNSAVNINANINFSNIKNVLVENIKNDTYENSKIKEKKIGENKNEN